jgi:hypothetical protein
MGESTRFLWARWMWLDGWDERLGVGTDSHHGTGIPISKYE